MKQTVIVLSCEHGGNQLPKEYALLFQGKEEVLNTHRGIDFGALFVFKKLQERFKFEGHSTTVSRLLIDCNRTISHPSCYSEFSRDLDKQTKEKIAKAYYWPYRKEIEQIIKDNIDKGYQVLHISVHSFTPEFQGELRKAAIGLLYDARRHAEKEVARIWHALLFQERPAYHLRLNYPYNGASDGLTSHFRKLYPETSYLGIELETNQSLLQDPHSAKQITEAIVNSVEQLQKML